MQPKIIALIGPSGSGKSTIQHLMGRPKIVTVTTRAPREGERNGVDYYFMSEEQFRFEDHKKRFIETAQYGSAWYGSHVDSVERAFDSPTAYSIILEAQGVEAYVKRYKDRVLVVGVMAPATQCYERMKASRGAAVADARMEHWLRDMAHTQDLAAVVLNNSDRKVCCLSN